MDLRAGFHLAEWTVHPEQNRLSGPGGDVHLTSRAMDVLVHLAEHAGAVVSREDFSRSVWGETVVGDDAVTWCISELRRQLGDQASSPRFIKTIPKRGYRLVAPVRALDENAPTAGAGRAEPRPVASDRSGWAVKPRWLLALLALAGLAAVGGWLWLGHRQPAAQPDQSIAVLPFYNFSTNLHNPFAEGIHHDLLTRLSNIADLRVISSTSVRQYRDSDQPIPEIARELNVAWVMEGAIQQVGDEIQVNAQLIDAGSDTHAWARTYRRELTAENLFAIQADIVDDIASAMQAHLSPDEADRVVRVPTENLEAYALMIRGATLLGRRTELAMRRAAELFRQAIDQDRDYPDAWAGETQRARQLTETIAASDAGYALGIARLGLGELDAALDALGQNGWNDNQAIVLRYHPFLDPLRDDERFAAIIRRLDRHWRLAEG